MSTKNKNNRTVKRDCGGYWVMNVYVLIYEGFTQFEVVLANYFLATKGEIITVGITKESVASVEGFLTQPHMILGEVDLEEVDIFIIPGGSHEEIEDNHDLYSFLEKLNIKNKKIAAICSGSLHLAKVGLLEGKKYTTTLQTKKYEFFDDKNYQDELVVVDGNIITAKANGYVDFALKLGEVMDIFEDDDDYNETVKFFREFKG